MNQCPKCDGELEFFQVQGTGTMGRFAPFICSWCASVLIVDNEERKLIDPDELKKSTGMDALALLKQNSPAMWDVIEMTTAQIRQLPNRRKVLR